MTAKASFCDLCFAAALFNYVQRSAKAFLPHMSSLILFVHVLRWSRRDGERASKSSRAAKFLLSEKSWKWRHPPPLSLCSVGALSRLASVAHASPAHVAGVGVGRRRTPGPSKAGMTGRRVGSVCSKKEEGRLKERREGISVTPAKSKSHGWSGHKVIAKVSYGKGELES